MARIKYVINERRLAYEGAINIFKERKQRRLARRSLQRQERKALLARKARATKSKDKKQAKSTATGEAANLVASGLFGAEPVATSSTTSQ